MIIYNPTRNNTEYFMIENRYKGALPIRNYDSFISASVVAGPVLWHASSRTPPSIQIYPPPTADPAAWPGRLMTYGWVAGGIQDWGTITPGKTTPLTWADGTSACMTVVGVSAGSTSVVTLRKP